LEKSDNGRVDNCRRDKVSGARVKSTTEDTIVAMAPAISFVPLEDDDGAYDMMRSVMTTFWIVKKKFSPYVEKGKSFRNE